MSELEERIESRKEALEVSKQQLDQEISVKEEVGKEYIRIEKISIP